MGKLVYTTEFNTPRVGTPDTNTNAKKWLVSQMYTDAVFNQDIRVIQTIIDRIDGGLPKDVDVDNYQTLFGDCLNDVLNMDRASQLKITPEDSVMLAMCKSLYDIAQRDIYYDYFVTPEGKKVARKKKPTTEAKQERDAALRIVLERSGGRKTNQLVHKQLEEVEVADWITESLPASKKDETPEESE